MLIWKAWKAHGFNLPKVDGVVSNAMSLNEPQSDPSGLEVASKSFRYSEKVTKSWKKSPTLFKCY